MNEQLVKLIDKHSSDGTLYSFGHIIYKETVCGPWVAFILSDGEDAVLDFLLFSAIIVSYGKAISQNW